MEGEARDYRYDVFVSHKREPPGRELITPWLVEVVKRLEYWLGQGLGGVEARVFFDARVLEVGGRWPADLQRALGTSRCLLPFWSPAYFRSRWCVAEWQSFRQRELLVGEGTCLIVPVRFHDGEWFPEDAKRVTSLDVRPYTATTAAFWETRRADELDMVLQDFSRRLADVVRRAPPFDPEWPLAPLPDPPDPPASGPMRRP